MYHRMIANSGHQIRNNEAGFIWMLSLQLATMVIYVLFANPSQSQYRL